MTTYRSELALAVAILLIEGVVSFWSPQVFSYGNIANVAQAAAPLVIMSLGVLLVIITSGIDLSVGSTFSLSGMVAGLTMLAGASWPIGCLAGLAVGIVVGAINGALVTFVGLAPFVVTLITYAVGASLAFVITDGHSIALLDPTFYLLNSGHLISHISNFVLFCLVARSPSSSDCESWCWGGGSTQSAATTKLQGCWAFRSMASASASM